MGGPFAGRAVENNPAMRNNMEYLTKGTCDLRELSKMLRPLALILLFISILGILSILPSGRWSSDVHSNESNLEILESVVRYANLYYVDKGSLSPREMLMAGLGRLEQTIDEVLVEFPDDASKSFSVQVLGSHKTFDLEGVDDLYTMTDRMDEVFGYILPRLTDDRLKPNAIEYAVVDEMLKTLDPHSGIITPEIYREFMVETKGSFGGLGIVIGIRDGQLTVIAPIEGTPAYRAGIKPNDRIVQIENESTVNMSLIEAVSKLRGPKGAPVSISITREGLTGSKPVRIVRGTIKIESVESFYLGEGIGYVRIRDFQKNTLSSLRELITKLRTSSDLSGIILDLRGNPGGLLDQAQKISDFFLDRGVIVTTRVGSSSRSYKARARSSDFRGNLVVLVDAGSASASEIVAGALKNNDRALIIGSRTFGKGSVQQIFDLDDGSALKLTIADYLTPGNISIQDVGITPDVLLQPAIINKDSVRLTPNTTRLKKEKIGESHLVLETPAYSILYLDPSLQTPEGDEVTPDEALTKDEKMKRVESDVYVQVAKQVLLKSGSGSRARTLEGSREQIHAILLLEEKKIEDQLSESGVDWTAGKTTAGKAWLSVKTIPRVPVTTAGETISITGRVTNKGRVTLNRLKGTSISDNPMFSGKEFIFGKLAPGKIAEWTVQFEVPKNSITREDEIKLRFESSQGYDIPDYAFNIRTTEIPRPAFAFTYEVVDDGRLGSTGNGDGTPDLDEEVVLLFRVKNTGEGPSEKAVVSLRSLSGDDLFLSSGRAELTDIHPGKFKEVPLRFKVMRDTSEFEFQFGVLDEVFREGITNSITIPANKHATTFKPTPPYARTTKTVTNIRGSGFSAAPVVAVAPKGEIFRAAGQKGEWIKVWLDIDSVGWISSSDATFVTSSITTASTGYYVNSFEEPPSMQLTQPSLSTTSRHIDFRGRVQDSDGIELVSIFVGTDKVKLIPGNGNSVNINTSLRIEDGTNYITVVSKDTKGLSSRKSFVIRKLGS